MQTGNCYQNDKKNWFIAVTKSDEGHERLQRICCHTSSVRKACLLGPSNAVNAASRTRERYATTLIKDKQIYDVTRGETILVA